MNALDQFTIPVSGLSDGLHEYDFDIGREFFQQFEGSLVEEANVQVHFTFDKRTDLYILTFEFEGEVKTTCDRCLEEFDLPVEDEQSLLVKFDETEWEDADVIYILQGTQSLNVARYIYEFINLAVPITKTHDDAGESCDPEMLKFIEQEEDEPEDDSGSVWDSLKGLNLDN
jgi:uncharacterized protein